MYAAKGRADHGRQTIAVNAEVVAVPGEPPVVPLPEPAAISPRSNNDSVAADRGREGDIPGILNCDHFIRLYTHN